jgi:NACalpha-BTF3-like transcription factor
MTREKMTRDKIKKYNLLHYTFGNNFYTFSQLKRRFTIKLIYNYTYVWSKKYIMSENRKVSFCVNTKPPNNEKIKIHTTKTNHIENNAIEIIMFQSGSTYEVAVEAYNKFHGDVVDSLMYIDEQKTGV